MSNTIMLIQKNNKTTLDNVLNTENTNTETKQSVCICRNRNKLCN